MEVEAQLIPVRDSFVFTYLFTEGVNILKVITPLKVRQRLLLFYMNFKYVYKYEKLFQLVPSVSSMLPHLLIFFFLLYIENVKLKV